MSLGVTDLLALSWPPTTTPGASIKNNRRSTSTVLFQGNFRNAKYNFGRVSLVFSFGTNTCRLKPKFTTRVSEIHTRISSNWHYIGRIRLSVSTVNRTYELPGITHVTSFRKYEKHSTGPNTNGPWVRTYSKLFSCKFVLTVSSYRAQWNEIHTYGRVSPGSIPRVRRNGLLYLRQSNTTNVWDMVNQVTI